MRSRSSIPKLIAHRTNAGGCPENSLSGIRAALALGIDMIELDLQRTTDGRLVLMHDSTVSRTTNGKGKVKEFSYAEISQLELLGKNAVKEKIPLFEEVLSLVRGSGVQLVLEFKNPKHYPGIGAEAVKMLEDFGMRDQVAVISFDNSFLKDFKSAYPDIFVASLCIFPRGPKSDSGFDGVGVVYFVLQWIGNNTWLRKLLRLENIQVFTYTVNSKKAMKKLLKLKVDGIISDRPKLLLRTARKERL